MRATAYVATSVDGFIARENGSLDWLGGGAIGEGHEDYGYQAFLDSVDVIVMGRKTYEFVLSLSSWPYGEKPVVILTSGQVDIPVHIARTVESMSASPRDVVRRLARRGFRHAYVDGGQTIQGFLREGLVHRLIITKIPILLGTGIPLFGPLPQDVRLRHVETKSFGTGLVQSTYEVLGSAS